MNLNSRLKIINISIFIISLVGIAILYLHLNETIDFMIGWIGNFALFLGLMIPFSLLFFGFVALRDVRVYLLWLLLSIGMLLFYIHFRDFAILQMKRGSALKSFKSLISFLTVFQVGRLICIKVTGREYITPSIGGSSDLIEDKKPQIFDLIMFGILFLSIIAGQEIGA